MAYSQDVIDIVNENTRLKAEVERLEAQADEVDGVANERIFNLRREVERLTEVNLNNVLNKDLEIKKLREALELAVVMIKQLEQAAPGNEIPGEYRMDGLDKLKQALKGSE